MPSPTPTPSPLPTRIRIVAVVRPFQLDDVMAALHGLGLADVLIQQVRGYGRQKSHLEFYGQHDFQGGFLPKVRLEFVVDDARRQDVIDAIRRGARTGRIGDGKIFIHAVTAPAVDAAAPAADAAASSAHAPSAAHAHTSPARASSP